MGLRERAAEAQSGLREFVEDAAQRNGTAVEQAPDVDASGIDADLTAPVHVAWSRMMRDVQWLGKNRRTTSGSIYSYRGIDDVMNVVGPALRKHGVMVIPTGIDPTFTVIQTKGGASMNYCRATVHFTIYGPTGDSFQAAVLGEGFDTGDKSGSKAQSIALRTLYLNGLAIQTNEPSRDTEYGEQHELAAPRPPRPDEYAEEIQRSTTTMDRLHWLRRQFADHPEEASATVELLGGERITLGDLLTRVGRARQEGR